MIFSPTVPLEELDLNGSSIQDLSKRFGDLRKLRRLNSSMCRQLTMLPDSFGSLQSLEESVFISSGIQDLQSKFGELRKLRRYIYIYFFIFFLFFFLRVCK
ncbi:hypothetical protein M758_2G205600 [Ceratodon purpureus]|nr:hypothetical protein M758_2G205600 [Ceratodon purpureus]